VSAEGFAAVPNWLYRDRSVSLYAIMVYGALASHAGPGGIHPSQEKLAAEARCSDRQVRRALAELEQLGVVVRVRRKNSVGRAPNGYILHPNGRLRDDEEVADSQSDTPEVPDSSDGGSGLDVQLVPITEEEPIKKTVGEFFEEFWAVYPRHIAKAPARAKFVHIAKKVDLQVVVDGARRFAADPNLPEPAFIPYPTTWLNQERWEDEALPPRADRPAAPAGDDVEEWMRR
jgi:hypothetical protein